MCYLDLRSKGSSERGDNAIQMRNKSIVRPIMVRLADEKLINNTALKKRYDMKPAEICRSLNAYSSNRHTTSGI